MTLGGIALLIGAYVLGSIPTGYWLGKAWDGTDIRQHGSGNLGATNVMRVMGTWAGLVTLAIDFLKGLIAVVLAKHFFPEETSLAAAAGLLAIIGHTASVFLNFRGGKGVATAAGVFAALLPGATIAAVLIFAATLGATRYVSLGSLLGVLTLAVSAFIFDYPSPLPWVAVAVAAYVIWTHRANIQRLRQKTEPRIDWRHKSS